MPIHALSAHVISAHVISGHVASGHAAASYVVSALSDRLAAWWAAAWGDLPVTGKLMLALGIVGQLLFVSRWFVQWLASEKARRSVMPTAFWYLSLAGGLMVLAYGIYDANLVLILGQFGVFIYARNIWLIWRSGGQRDVLEAEDRVDGRVEGEARRAPVASPGQ